MEGADKQDQTKQNEDFTFGRTSTKNEADKKKKKTVDTLAEERLKSTFNVGAGAKDHDELKRKREDFAV